MKTIVYIDGGNLYHGKLRYRVGVKWLDLVAFCRALVKDDHEITAIKYFTSHIKTHPYDPQPIERQNIYLQALSSSPLVSVIEGYYQNKKKWLPAAREVCASCNQSKDGYLRIFRMEEKRTDVNLATELLFDAFKNNADSFVLISGDSDFIGPLDLVRREFNKQVVIFNPRDGQSDLMYHANYYSRIPDDLAAKCQLPNEVNVKGRVFRKPASW